MKTYLTGIGWVTGGGFGWGSQGGACTLSALPLPVLSRKEVFPEPNQRFGRMSDYAKLGLAAMTFALRDAGLECWGSKRPVGVVVSTRLGCLATDLEYHCTVLLQGGGLASPNLFAYTLANCFLGDAAIQFGLSGSAIAINETSADGLGALRMAMEEIALGEATTILAGICDLPVPDILSDCVTLQAGALFLVLSTAPGRYGTVALATDGTILYNGGVVASLIELIQTALAGRTIPPRPSVTPPTSQEG